MPCRRRKALPASLLAVISHVSLPPPLAKAGGNGVVNCCLCHSHLVLVCLLTLGFQKEGLSVSGRVSLMSVHLCIHDRCRQYCFESLFYVTMFLQLKACL
ncbi:hypothetical protein MRX96_041844 [Rhipicephalus microplus]